MPYKEINGISVGHRNLVIDTKAGADLAASCQILLEGSEIGIAHLLWIGCDGFTALRVFENGGITEGKIDF